MRERARWAGLGILAGFVLGGASTGLAVAQETTRGPEDRLGDAIEIQLVQGWSDHEDLESPTGVGLRYAFGPGPFRFALGYRYRVDGRVGAGRACVGLFDPRTCPLEVVERDFDAHTFEVEAGFTEPLREGLEARAGASLGLTLLAGSVEGRSTGNAVDLGRETGLGGSIRGGVAWSPRSSDRIALLLDGRLEIVGGGGCGEDGHFPFCDSAVIGSFEAGMAIRR